VVFLIGVAKLFLGIQLEKPIDFLVFLIFAVVVLASVWRPGLFAPVPQGRLICRAVAVSNA